MRLLRRLFKNLIILAFWLAVWQALSMGVSQSLLLPSPGAVLLRLFELALEASFWRTAAISLFRILLGTLAAVILGAVLAVFTAMSAALYALVSPLLAVIRATPVASFILLVLLWLGREALPAFTAFLMVLPVIWANTSAGIKGVDFRLLQMAEVYRFGRLKRFRRVYIPSVMPHFLSAVRTSIGLAWKAGIAAEVLTVPKDSIGKMLYAAKLNLETIDLFAWTLVIILCSLIIERVVVAAIGKASRGYAAWEERL